MLSLAAHLCVTISESVLGISEFSNLYGFSFLAVVLCCTELKSVPMTTNNNNKIKSIRFSICLNGVFNVLAAKILTMIMIEIYSCMYERIKKYIFKSP